MVQDFSISGETPTLHPSAAEHITAAVSDALSGTASHSMTHLEAG
jgi:hypothetical protein